MEGLWKVSGSEQFLRGMWEYFTLGRPGPRNIPVDAAQEKQERKARSVATGISLQRGSGTSQKK